MSNTGKYRIRGIANVKVLKNFQDLFLKLTGLNIAFVNETGEFVTHRRGRCPFCMEIKNAGLGFRCRESDKKACTRARRLRKPVIYKCFAGLTEIVTPIIVNKRHLGSAIGGQIRVKGENAELNPQIKKKVSNRVYKKLEENFKKVPELDSEIVASAPDMLMLIIKYIFTKELELLVTKGKISYNSTSEKIVNTAIDYIEEKYNSKIYLKDVAKKLFVSPSYLSRVFSEETGFTISDYIKKLRLETATSLLKNTDKSIKAISREVGYRDLPYFYKIFKKRYEITPKLFRKTYIRTEES